MKVRIDPMRCHNTEYCIKQSPQLFAPALEGGPTRVLIEQPGPALHAAARGAEMLCPTGAIIIEDDR